MHREQVIRRASTFGLSIVFLVLVLLAMWDTIATQRAANRTKQAVTLSDRFETAAKDIDDEALAEREYRLSPSPAIARRQQAAATATGEALANIRDIGDPEDRRIAVTALAAHATYLDAMALMFAAVDASDAALTHMIANKSVEPSFAIIAATIDDRLATLHRSAIVSLADLARTQNMVRRTTLLVLTIGIVFLVIFLSLLDSYRKRIDRALASELARLSHEATTDNLTHLGNHRAYQEALAHTMATALASGEDLTLALLDIDEFKILNDENGHSSGDRALALLGSFLGELRSGDRCLPFRIGGDEFALLMPRLSLATATLIMRRFQTRCAAGDLGATLSIGLAALGADSQDIAVLQKRADRALYEAKRLGRNRLASFDDVEDGEADTSMSKRAALRALLERGDLAIAFQPIWDVARDTVLGYEALTRVPAAYGFIGPQEAFDLAERTGHAHELDALAHAAIIARAHEIPGDALLFINVSPQTLDHESFGGNVLIDAAARVGLAPERIVLEVTERSVARTSIVVREAKRLRALGFRLALDDVGVGNSGLDMLGRLPVDFLKIDGELVARARDDRPSRSVITGILAIARENGTYVIAEGVEDPATLAFLQTFSSVGARGIDGFQGYLIGHPSERLPEALASPLGAANV